MNKPSALKDIFIIGVTGGIGAGKTAVTDRFEQFGIQVVDADLVARKVVLPNSPVLQQITEHFGTDFLLNDGNLNRAKLRQRIFSDEAAKSWLNSVMFPAIRAELMSQLSSSKSGYVILSAPLLFENNLDTYCDRVLVVDVDEATQMLRASGRDGVDPQQIKAIISSQIDRQQRIAKADDILDNSGDLAHLSAQVEAFHQKYLTLVP